MRRAEAFSQGLQITAEFPERDAEAIEALFDVTFGPGHFAKTAERLREYNRSLPEISRVARLEGQVIGVCRVWPISVGGTPALFYGPVAVAPAHQGSRLGLSITGEAIEAGIRADWQTAVLIGAPMYFGEIGFKAAPRGSLVFPGPQDEARVLVRHLAGPHYETFGRVSALKL